MILDKDKIAEACRYLDAKAEEFGSDGLELIVRDQLGIDLAGMLYLAQQRGLRTALIRDGQDPLKLSRTEFTAVKLSRSAREELPYYSSAWIDGFAAGVAAEKERNR